MNFLIPLLISAVSLCPLFLIFLDYHKKNNIHKAVLFIVSLVATIIVLGILVGSYGLKLTGFIWIIPVLLFGLLGAKHLADKRRK